MLCSIIAAMAPFHGKYQNISVMSRIFLVSSYSLRDINVLIFDLENVFKVTKYNDCCDTILLGIAKSLNVI